MNVKYKKLLDELDGISSSSPNWQVLHDKLLELHESSGSEEEYVLILNMYHKLMQKVETQLVDVIDIEQFNKVRNHEYNLMLLRESTIGESLCVETLYELTQRELEAGRMPPTHEFIDIAIQATATDHYSRDQLLRQKDRIDDLKNQSTLGKLARLINK